jgi:diguanylate cyclase (GGDEF)-like protein
MVRGALSRLRSAGESDPYRYVDLVTATRAGGAMFFAGVAFATVTLPLSAPSGPLGYAGVIAFIVLAVGLGVRQLRRRTPAGPHVNLVGVYVSLIAAAVYRAGSGPGASFEQLLFMIAIYACAVHPVRRSLLVLFCATAVSLTPTWYETVDRQFLSEAVSQLLLTWIVGAVVLGWMTRVRHARAEAESAVEEADQLARIDPLTGLGNRRALEEALPLAVAAARRTGEPLAVLVGDLDDFKGVNDIHGHQAGDDLLRRAARSMNAALRLSDPCFRFGGDEFVAILPNADLEEALEAAGRVASTVALSCRTPDGRPLRITVGAAEVAEGETGMDAFVRADAELLATKTRRRATRAAQAG